jgi:hypothetical protein
MGKRSFPGFTAEESESFLHWDYPAGVVHFYTTRRDVFERFLKRTEGIDGRKVSERERTITLPLGACRHPALAVRLRKKAT